MKRYFAALCFLLLLSFTSMTIFATDTTKEATAGDTIYIAGNPDLYPLEYYDEDTKSYQGILPSFYAELSEQTKLKFTYVSSGKRNQQKRLASNKQVELVSAHTEDISAISDVYSLVSFDRNGASYTVKIGFTDIMPKQAKSLILKGLESKTEGEWLSASLAVEATPTQSTPWFWYICVCILLILSIVLLIIILKARQQKKFEHEKMTDTLTGIGNLEYLHYCLDHYVSNAMFYLYYVAYIALNSEHFEKYLGTTELEDVQHFAASILSADISDNDFVARINNGVFVLFFQTPDESRAEERIEELLHKLNINKQNVVFRAGIYHPGKSKLPLESMIQNAKQGYQYALENRQLCCISNKEILDHFAFQNRLRKKLTNAVADNQFELFLQFIVNREGKIIGAEALSRWNSPEEGLLTPRHYIDDMKNLGIIDQLDFLILDKACKQLADWNTPQHEHLAISCNFTRVTFSSPDFLSKFHEFIQKYNFDHKRLILELTEDSLADNLAIAYQNVLTCKKEGFRIALDDLGSGYSSLSDLCDYPIDIIKIDRHIVAKSSTPKGNTLLHGLTEIAHRLGIQVLCEGIETEEENLRIINTGCDYIQGFFYSRVFPKENAMDYYKEYSRKHIATQKEHIR